MIQQTEQAAKSNCDNVIGRCKDAAFGSTSTSITADAAVVVEDNNVDNIDTDPSTSPTGGNDDASGTADDGTYHGMRSLILILALSLHHLFEGISLGLQRTVAGAFTLLIALLCHETIISFSLGLQFVKCSYSSKQHYITAFACSIVEPIGVAVGNVLDP